MMEHFSSEDELDLEEPPVEVMQWAKKNLGEDPDTRCQVIASLRDMIYACGECTPHRMDDEYLLKFLRARNFNVDKAHGLMVRYNHFKDNNPSFFQDVDLNHLKKMGDDGIISVPPVRERSGRRMLIYRVGQWDPDTISVNDWFQATLVVLELAIMEPRAQVLGGIGIFDFGGLTMKQALHMTPNIAHKVIQIMVTCFPLKIHALHIVNQSNVFNAVYMIFKPFLNEKMKQRIFFHGDNWESLHEHIDPKFLPKRYGGMNPDYNYKKWIQKLRKYPKVIQSMISLGYEDNYIDDDNENNTTESEHKL